MRSVLALATLATLAAVALPGAPALAKSQETKIGQEVEQARRFAMPLLVSPGLPNPAGTFTLRMNGIFLGVASPASTGVTADSFLGITPRLGVNLRTGFTQTGTALFAGTWSNLHVEGQYAVMQTDDKAAGLSLVAAGIIPGGVGGHNLGAITPAFGIRGQATAGPLQTHVDSLYHPGTGTVGFGLSGVLQVTDQVAGSLDLLGDVPLAGGAGPSLGIAPGVSFRLTPGIRAGVGYVLPAAGTPPQSGQLLAHMQLGM